jgi:hypothetical protein
VFKGLIQLFAKQKYSFRDEIKKASFVKEASRACLNFTLWAAKWYFLNLSTAVYYKIALLFCNKRALPEPRITTFRLQKQNLNSS